MMGVTMMYPLECKYDSRKSFYGKAMVEVSGGWGQNVSLYSYDTLVAFIGYDEDEEFCCYLTAYWDYSPTTLRHVKEFLRQYGFGAWSKPEIYKHWEEVDGYLKMVRD